ncbi:MAG: tRNA lysidine(34) synthetase TilS [Gemmatimonadaceae bacterium]
MDAETTIPDAVGALLGREPRVVLAVSGGVDSIVLLHAAARVRSKECDSLIVATFDHGTGLAATNAANLVRRIGEVYGLAVESGYRAAPAAQSLESPIAHANSEASWREARWHFLREVADRQHAVVATAHTRDDQIETVAMRIIRGAGVRGLAGLLADSDVVRPLLSVSRSDVVRYAREHELEWIEDPSNRSRRHFRNRVRLDLLPAVARVHPAFEQTLLEISTRAAGVRRSIERVASSLSTSRRGRLFISRKQLGGLPEESLPFVWQALAARERITLDRRGTMRLTRQAATLLQGGRIPLSGRFELVATADEFSFRRCPPIVVSNLAVQSFALAQVTQFGPWRFSPVSDATINQDGTSEGVGTWSATLENAPWTAWLPTDRTLSLRGWRDGDRIAANDVEARCRRVKRFFADRHISAVDRVGWPVVVAGDEIIWIPGIRRTSAASVRSGRPGVCMRCERLDV